ncbi:MAG: NAD(P)H-dependent glycerol-3-phosphate dehydrogenase, partial [Thiohalobacterales bacterium]|nr:NAD(P)H-dependent glycerol-3-phosphate dehydrogenase [Thiohalobacterales bacterium]
MNSDRITVLGAGSWGTALAIRLATRQDTLLWGHEADAMATLAADRENAAFLPGIPFPAQLAIEPVLERAVGASRDLLIVVPSHAFREVIRNIAPLLADDARIAWATKGLEQGSGKFMSDVLEEELGSRYPSAVLSGPTFALEVARGLPTALTVASGNTAFANDLATRLHGDVMRVYTSDDMLGVQLGGTVKNVLAIAAGITDGLALGANSRAALITRGLAEIIRLGDAMGARRETLMGLAGVGDLILTCTDDLSRNRRLGLALGRGTGLKVAVEQIGQVVEGFNTAREVVQLARTHKVDMPISEQVYRVLYEDLSPQDAVHNLLARDIRS